VTVRRNRRSLPIRLAALRVRVRVGAPRDRRRARGDEVARHSRLPGSQQRAARLDHYLELRRRKPGALKHSLALRQEAANSST